jgi:hypothetical protein
MIRIVGFAALAAMFGLVGLAQADTHHNAQSLLGKKLNTDGKHELHTHGEHTAHAHVKGGKVAKVEVTHKTKGAVNVTKYKSAKKHHAQAESGVEHHYVGFNPDATNDDCGGAVIAFVGWGYVVGGVVIIYWFPVAIVIGGEVGAIIYNP